MNKFNPLDPNQKRVTKPMIGGVFKWIDDTHCIVDIFVGMVGHELVIPKRKNIFHKTTYNKYKVIEINPTDGGKKFLTLQKV